MHQKTMSSVSGIRERLNAPARYRRKTMVCSVPNSARLSSTPRSSSALDHKWVHRSQGDLTVDMDLQIHPRLQSDFYQDLYKKYPQAFGKRKEARDAGRKLFNSQHHVRFKDEVDVADTRSASSLELRSPHSKRDKHLTNWDREVGHFLNHSANTRDCFTSAEPSECSGSVMWVTQRLKLNSQTLNKLLNEESPLRNRFRRDKVQYDESGTENEQSLEDYVLEKSRERSRHRKHQRRIIIQRKILKAESENMISPESDVENNMRNRRWMSKSASPTRRNLIQYSLPPAGMHRSKSNSHHIDVESLIADSDLKIDTLLENIGAKPPGSESPPDSAIDIDTPSVQSFVVTGKEGNSQKTEMVLVELPDLNDKESGPGDKCVSDEMESSPGSSASAHVVRNGTSVYSGDEDEVLMASKNNSVSHSEHARTNDVQNGVIPTFDDQFEIQSAENRNEIDEISRIVDKYASLDNLNVETGPGLLQLYSAEMGYSDFNVCNDSEAMDGSPGGEGRVNGDINVDFNESAINGDINNSVADKVNIEGDVHVDKDDINKEVEIETEQSNENDVIKSMNTQVSKDMKTARDSDVDSGLGYSSACTDALPPHGRSRQRERTMKSHPIQADHSIVPLKSDVDVDILNEVNLMHLSHDIALSCDYQRRDGKWIHDEVDDTDATHGVSKYSEEKRLTQKYIRVRTPSPFILRNRHPSPGFRPKSAPSFARSENDIRIVDIPLRDDGTDTSHCLPSSIEPVQSACHKSKQNHLQNKFPNSNLIPCQNSNIGSQFVSMPNLAGTDELGTVSSNSNRQRNYSSNSASSKESSVSPLSESETDTATQVYVTNYKSANVNNENIPPGAYADMHARGTENNHKFKDVDFDSETAGSVENMAVLTQSDITKKKGMYKPSVTSPRVKEKRLKLRNILKNKKGAFSPSAEEAPERQNAEEKNVVNRIYAKRRGGPNAYENWGKRSEDSISQKSGRSTDADVEEEGSVDRFNDNPNHPDHLSDSIRENHGRLTPYDVAKTNSLDTESVDNFITGENTGTVTARPVVLDRNSNGPDPRSANNLQTFNPGIETVRPVSPMKAQPPKKPARTKKKNKSTPNELNLSQYKIEQNGSGLHLQPPTYTLPSGNELNLSHGSSQSDYQSTSSEQEEGRTGRKSLSLRPPDNEIEVLEPHISNLKKNKEMTSSKSSLFDKMKIGKFKSFKKAMSMDRGIDSAGHGANDAPQPKGGNSFFPKMKKAPSLKSITSLFSRRKKKRGQFRIDDHEGTSTHGSTLTVYSGQSDPLSNGKKQWASCHTLSTIESPTTDDPIKNQKKVSHEFQPMGKLQKMYPDGSQVIQLVKPENGPIGFFIAKGSAKYGNGIFVSRFSATRPEQCFAGLLGVGDEILEVNGHCVRDLSQDSVYNLISASPVVVLKIFPFIARRDV